MAANLALQDARWADAVTHLQRAIQFETGEKLLHGRLGLALLFDGDPTKALAEFESEHRADPKWEEYDLRRAQTLQALGRLPEALETYQRALTRPTTSSETRDSLAALRPR